MSTAAHTSQSLSDAVAVVIDRLRPAVQADGGDIQLVEVTPDGIVRVRLLGACIGCPSSMFTLKFGVERAIKDAVSGIREVVCA